MNARWLRALAAIALAGLTVACGGGRGEPAEPALDTIDFEFQPDALAVFGGRQVTIKVTNKGKVVHNVSIPDIEADLDYEPGQSTNLIFIAPESGPVEFYCKYHRDRGMTGAFIVRKRSG